MHQQRKWQKPSCLNLTKITKIMSLCCFECFYQTVSTRFSLFYLKTSHLILLFLETSANNPPSVKSNGWMGVEYKQHLFGCCLLELLVCRRKAKVKIWEKTAIAPVLSLHLYCYILLMTSLTFVTQTSQLNCTALPPTIHPIFISMNDEWFVAYDSHIIKTQTDSLL